MGRPRNPVRPGPKPARPAPPPSTGHPRHAPGLAPPPGTPQAATATGQVRPTAARRSPLAEELTALILRPAHNNPTWGYVRIQGELRRLGHRVATATIRRVLRRNKIPPAPTRTTEHTWRAFLHTQTDTPPATDFFHVNCAITLKRLYVSFVMELGSRTAHVLGVTTHPTGDWITQQARNLPLQLGDPAHPFRFLNRDRDTKFTQAFDTVLAGNGTQVLKAAPQAPKMNAFAERWTRTAPAEYTDRMLIFGERHLRTVLVQYATHYNTTRAHRSLDLHAPGDDPTVIPFPAGRVRRRKILDGLLNEYHRTSR
ncbi:integrase core domain-containing protein [Streptomyces sp. NBC_01003]|uniref:integrase core domain-containing protein n=1 Tax=Streptomyces sp. NBC_01003 TaxID=2903714 RepID=UPI0038708A90|nr:integrase core domain-containing protein [Streptomyces sp. NBC_01003]